MSALITSFVVATINRMAKQDYKSRKENCPECCGHTVFINPDNCNYLIDLQSQKRKNRSKKSIELLINEIISEHRISKEIGVIK